MKRIWLFTVYFIFFTQAYGQLPYWQQQVNYKLDVALNDTSHTLDGYVKMEYYNNSPDTLRYIWIHVWPNAYKNDRTAFSDQQLENGNTDFYFAATNQRGYINRLNFRVNNLAAVTEDHPQHQDIIKLLLPAPLLPNTFCKIETPFHVKLPNNFSRGGHKGQSYQITQWYPKPAVYDAKGWHAMPYLDQGEFYSELGNYEVQITVPQNYVVAATGNLQDAAEIQWLKGRHYFKTEKTKTANNKTITAPVPSASNTKTLQYVQNSVHDFAWFADKLLAVNTDTLLLPSGRIINVYAYYYPDNKTIWTKSTGFIKQAVRSKSYWLGEYPYDVVSVVEDEADDGGMEYPTITYLSAGGSEKMLDFVINHEVGHNWFYGILATNERQHPWMDEGMNTYYDNRYMLQQYGSTQPNDITSKSAFLQKRLPDDIQQTVLQAAIAAKKDQPIDLPAEKFNYTNYGLIAYTKTGNWLQLLEKELGTPLFDSCMQAYYAQWRFKHPYPEDFKKIIEATSGRDLTPLFALLHKKGNFSASVIKKDLRFTSFFSLKETEKHHYIFVSPALGYNTYDNVMAGLLLHNYTMPASKLQFVLAPLYAPKSKSLNGIGRLSYNWLHTNEARTEIALAAARFNGGSFTDSTGTVNNLFFSKLVPSIKYVFANKNSRSSITKYIQWKTFFINEEELLFQKTPITQIDTITYPVKSRYLNQLQFVVENNRALYPYKGVIMAEQSDGFLRLAFTGNYYFNYNTVQGLNMRVFAGKFFYTKDKTFLTELESERYHLTMTGPRGSEDYTYSNYFAGRNAFDKLPAQQLMIRDGGFKTGTDLLFTKPGRTDNWLTAINLTSDIPDKINPLKILPLKIPIKVFLDLGTSAATWQKDAGSGRFIYNAGLQLPLLKGMLNVYLPLLYSKVYRDYYTLYVPEKKFEKKIAFSIDFSSSYVRKLLPFSGF